jgi:nitric oxide reductase activation protein
VNQFGFLAAFLAGRSLEIAEAAENVPAHTNGRVVFASAGGSVAQQRREIVLQSALLGAGSLEAHLMKPLRARPTLARRYLALEGRRVLAELADRLPLAAELRSACGPCATSSAESLEIAKGRGKVVDAPDWFGAIRPSLLMTKRAGPGTEATAADIQLNFERVDLAESSDSDSEGEESKILKLFENPLMKSTALASFLREILGNSRSTGDSAAGADMDTGSIRRVHATGSHAKPLSTRIHFTDDGKPGAAVGVGGVLHPEWDVHHDRYRPDWCRVIDFALTVTADVTGAAVPRDEVLRRRLSRVGLGPKVLRSRADGDELDIEALIDLFVDLRSGYSPPEHVYLERRKLARDLGVLILVDASGSATDADPKGLAVHEHQRRAAATIAATLEELGDRVAVYAFRSHGRHAVHLPAIKTFGQRFGAVARARLNQLQPSGYTRLGSGIRGAGEILKAQAGTQNRLLLLLSDGFPYDDDYEGRYAEADVSKALEELRSQGIACLCLSVGSAGDADALGRVFGATGYTSAATLAELSPQMDELFLSSLRELAAPISLRART